MNIYLASSWRNDFQPALVEIMRSWGHQVYDFRNPELGNKGFSWSDVDPDWKNWTVEQYKAGLQHPAAVKGFVLDFNAMQHADCCVMLMPCGRSAAIEAGYIAGRGKPVYVFFGPSDGVPEAELMFKICNGITYSLQELEGFLADRRSLSRDLYTSDPYLQTR